MENELRIPIGDMFLVAMVNDWQDDMPVEMCIYLETKDGVLWQDIALVCEHYRVMNHGLVDFVRDPSLIDVKVWGDSGSEDYTHEFTVGIFKEEEE